MLLAILLLFWQKTTRKWLMKPMTCNEKQKWTTINKITTQSKQQKVSEQEQRKIDRQIDRQQETGMSNEWGTKMTKGEWWSEMKWNNNQQQCGQRERWRTKGNINGNRGVRADSQREREERERESSVHTLALIGGSLCVVVVLSGCIVLLHAGLKLVLCTKTSRSTYWCVRTDGNAKWVWSVCRLRTARYLLLTTSRVSVLGLLVHTLHGLW
jgi:hypothetical protein